MPCSFFVCVLLFLETGSDYVDQIVLGLLVFLPQPLSAGITGVHHHAQLNATILELQLI
jgi:hypothetical protein